MKINESVWGLKANWVSSDSFPEIKFPSFKTLYQGVQEGRLEVNHLLEDSVNFIVASGNTCDWFYPTYAMTAEDGTPTLKSGYSDKPYIINGDYLPIFPALFGAGEGGGSGRNYIYREEDWGIDPDLNKDTLRTAYNGIAPMIDFDYSKMIFYIYVYAYNEELTGYVSVGVEDYYNEANTYMRDYPNITSIRYNCYYGDAGGRTAPNPTGNQASTQIIYMIPNKIFHLGHSNDSINYMYNLSIIGGAPQDGYFPVSQWVETGKPLWERSSALLGYMNPAHWTWKTSRVDTNTRGIFPIFTGTKEDIYAKASAFGVYFTGSLDSARNSALGPDCTDPLINLPIIVNGMTFGDYKSGYDTTILTNSTWGENAREDSGYEGNINIDTNDYTEEVPLVKSTISATYLFNKPYILDTNDVIILANRLNNADEDALTKIFDGFKLQGENPMNGIIGLKLFPFDVQRETGATSISNIKIGKWDTELPVFELPDNGFSQIFDLGSFTIYPSIYGVKNEIPTFLDYEPYTTIDCYIPYCGMVSLAPSEVMGKTINVKMTVDLYTGACEAVVYAEGYPVAYKTGVIAVDIPLTGTDSSALMREVLGGVINNAQSVIASGSKAASEVAGSPLTKKFAAQKFGAGALAAAPAAVTGVIGDTVKAVFSPTHFQSIGTATPSNAFSMPQYCYVMINRPEFDVGNYGKTVGWATNVSVPLIEMAGGLIKANNPRLDNVSATLEEKELLEDAIASGIILEAK